MKKAFIVMFLAICLGSLSMAETYEHKAGGLSIWFPDNWEVTPEGTAMSADAPDGDAFIVLDVVEAKNLDAALDAYDEALAGIVEGFEANDEEPREIELAGLNIVGISGTGTVEGEDWGVDVMLIGTGKAIVICISAISNASGDKYDAVATKIVESLKKI